MISSQCGGLCTLFDGFELGRDFASEIGMGGWQKEKIGDGGAGQGVSNTSQSHDAVTVLSRISMYLDSI